MGPVNCKMQMELRDISSRRLPAVDLGCHANNLRGCRHSAGRHCFQAGVRNARESRLVTQAAKEAVANKPTYVSQPLQVLTVCFAFVCCTRKGKTCTQTATQADRE